jgi:hypothetical protein
MTTEHVVFFVERYWHNEVHEMQAGPVVGQPLPLPLARVLARPLARLVSCLLSVSRPGLLDDLLAL